MMIEAMCVMGYRSVKHVYLPLERINVLVGPNGSGKTNLYRAMFLIHQAANGRLAGAMAQEGGMPSVLWAGPRRKEPVRLSLAVRFAQYSYHLECGLPVPGASAFHLDPEVKEERIYFHDGGKKSQLLGRKNTSVWARDDAGKRVEYPMLLSQSESVLAEIREPHRFPELSMLRQEVLQWRFYHHFRTDPDSPIRQPQVGVRTPVLSHDGRDLAAAIQTILEIGDAERFLAALRDGFPEAQLEIDAGTRFSLRMRLPGVVRFFEASELSDGTLQYLCLLTALLSPRPPTLMAINEPESSIHPDMLGPLARLMADAAGRSQLWVTTHAMQLADTLCGDSGCAPIQLEKVDGQTLIQSQRTIERAMTI
jgi:predicted ATPase